MQDDKFRKYYIDWWKIRRSTIYGLIAVVVLVVLATGVTWWALRYDWFAAATTTDVPKGAAQILSFEGDVRVTRVDTRETIVVTRETYVSPGDTIQTQADGRAVVQMADGSVYSVRPNSTVVIRDNSSLFGGSQVRVALDDGQLNVRTDEQGENTKNVVEMLDSETQLRSQTDASFNAEAGRGEIRISRGSVETTIGGERTVISEDEFASLSNGRVSGKEKLLSPPRPASPANMSQIDDTSGRGVNVAFTWQDEGPAVSYYMQVARTPFFAPDSILVDRGQITGREFRLAGLAPGNYYWRLKATSRSGQISDWSEPARFTVARRDAAGAITVDNWGFENVGGNVFIISGRTQPGMRVRSQGREVFAAGDGTFRMQVSAPGEITVELSDERGSRAGYVVSPRAGRVIRRL